jgi:hypothetical protein
MQNNIENDLVTHNSVMSNSNDILSRNDHNNHHNNHNNHNNDTYVVNSKDKNDDWFNMIFNENVVSCIFYVFVSLCYWFFNYTFKTMFVILSFLFFQMLEVMEPKIEKQKKNTVKFFAHVIFFYLMITIMNDLFFGIYEFCFYFGFWNTTIFFTIISIFIITGFINYCYITIYEQLSKYKYGRIILEKINIFYNYLLKLKILCCEQYSRKSHVVEKYLPKFLFKLFYRLKNINNKLGDNIYSEKVYNVYYDKVNKLEQDLTRWVLNNILFGQINNALKMSNVPNVSTIKFPPVKNNPFNDDEKDFFNVNVQQLMSKMQKFNNNKLKDDNNIDDLENSDTNTTECFKYEKDTNKNSKDVKAIKAINNNHHKNHNNHNNDNIDDNNNDNINKNPNVNQLTSDSQPFMETIKKMSEVSEEIDKLEKTIETLPLNNRKKNKLKRKEIQKITKNMNNKHNPNTNHLLNMMAKLEPMMKQIEELNSANLKYSGK